MVGLLGCGRSEDLGGRAVDGELQGGVGDIEVGGWDVAAPEGIEAFIAVDVREGGESGGVEWSGQGWGCEI